jgi:hypothetical protein
MPAVEVWTGRGRDAVITLSDATYTFGRDAETSDVTLDDPTVSSPHLILERIGATWLVRDLGSTNGTRLRGERLVMQRRLQDGDELVVGRTRLVFRDGKRGSRGKTDVLDAPPDDITAGEMRVLIELCRPLLGQNVFQEPASVKEIAARLFIGKNAVQFHLTNLYTTFGLLHVSGGRRVALANEAVQRGAVSLADLESPPGPDER